MTVDSELRGQRGLWRLHPPISLELRTALQGQSVMLAHLLCCRGYSSIDEIRAFLGGQQISHDPFLLPDMHRAVARIEQAIDQREVVAVYGDFDCDGITAAAALVDILGGLGLATFAHIPTRDEGHGVHPRALEMLAARGVGLIITADCGITATTEIAFARSLDMDIIVTDHHEARADGSLPDCPTVDPTRHDSLYPYRFLSGAGVVYKLAQALYSAIPGAPDPDTVLDLIALGTVADVVPLRDENRTLVQRGLTKLRETTRPGLLALYEVASVEPAKIDPTSVGFYLAPRINAANRMATPQLAYDLIVAANAATAVGLAEQLGEHNRLRQALVADTLVGLLGALGDETAFTSAVRGGLTAPIIVVEGDWPPGISGLLASKLVDLYGVPAFVGSTSAGDVLSFSARGTRETHIDEILERCEMSVEGGLFLSYGGHARAGGFRLPATKLALMHQALESQVVHDVSGGVEGIVLGIDAQVRLSDLNVAAARLLLALAPFGTDFDEPLFLARSVELKQVRSLKDGAHARLSLQQGTARLDGVLFHAPPETFALQPRTRLDIVFHLGINEWNGGSRPEMRVRDWRIADGAT